MREREVFYRISGVRRIIEGMGVYFALIILLIISGILSPPSINPVHLLNIARQASALGIVGIGQTFVIMTQGIDLSVGANLTLIEIMTAGMILGREEMVPPVVIFCLGIGALIGLINGLGVTKLKLSPFVMTLCMMSVLTGVYLLYCGGSPRGKIPDSLRFIGAGRIGNIFPTAIIVWIIVIVLSFIVLRYTIFGRYIYATGGNPRASYLSGVNVDMVIIIAYVISGVCSAIAGILLAGYIGTGSLTVGKGYDLNSIAAVIIGGTTFSGGRGGVIGTVGGAFVITLLFSLLTMLGMPHSGKLIAQGLIIIGIVSLYVKRR
ncbi:ABC transporter permease [Candidatus Aerophobetes bacterium]|nr:ABC transporter permease [Candidatus Aerophobetes bacterium]